MSNRHPIVSVVAFLSLATWGTDARAGTEPSPFRISMAPTQIAPVLDGARGVGEWDSGACLSDVADGDDGSQQGVTVCAQNDGDTLYMLLELSDADYSDPSEPCFDFMRVEFDDNNNGAFDVGENGFAVRFDGASILDGFTGVAGGFQFKRDAFFGGTSDIAGAITHSNPGANTFGTYTIELAFPLDSGDAHDFSLVAGDVVGFQIHMADGDPSPSLPCPVAPGGYNWPPDSATTTAPFAQLVVADAGEEDFAITTLSVPLETVALAGTTIPVTVGVANQGKNERLSTVTLKDGSTLVGSISIDIPIGATEEVTFQWPAASPGLHVLSAVVATVAGEGDTANNTASLAVEVIPSVTSTGGGDVSLGAGDSLGIGPGATYTGNISVDGGVLYVLGGTINGSVLGAGGGDIVLMDGAAVTGNIEHEGGTLTVIDSTVFGDTLRDNSTIQGIGSTFVGDFNVTHARSVSLTDVDVESGILIDITGAGIGGSPAEVSFTDVSVVNSIVIDITGAGVSGGDRADLAFEGVDVGNDVVIDVTSAGIGVQSSMLNVDVANGILIDITGAGVAGAPSTFDVSNTTASQLHLSASGEQGVVLRPSNVVIGQIVIDITAAGVIGSGDSTGDRVTVLVRDSVMPGDNVITHAGPGVVDVSYENSEIGGKLLFDGSAGGGGSLSIEDGKIDRLLEEEGIWLSLTRTTVGGSVRSQGPGGLSVVDSSIGGTLSARDKSTVLKVNSDTAGVVSVVHADSVTSLGGTDCSGCRSKKEMPAGLRVHHAGSVLVSGDAFVNGDLEIRHAGSATVTGVTVEDDLEIHQVDEVSTSGNDVRGSTRIH